MFRIAFFVEDKHLAKILHNLQNNVMNLEVHPVVNEKVVDTSAAKETAVKRGPYKKKKVVRAKTSGGSQVDRIIHHLVQTHGADANINSGDLKKAMKAERISEGNFGYIITGLQKRHAVKIIEPGSYKFHVKASEAADATAEAS